MNGVHDSRVAIMLIEERKDIYDGGIEERGSPHLFTHSIFHNKIQPNASIEYFYLHIYALSIGPHIYIKSIQIRR